MSSKKKQVEKLEPGQAREFLAEYMKKEYRPYGATDLVLNLHNRINKTLMAKLLDEMVEDGTLIAKKYGKLAFYCYSELKCDDSVKPIEIETLMALREEIKNYEQDSNRLKNEIAQLKNEPTDDQLFELEKELVGSVDELRQKIKTQTKDNSKITNEMNTQLADVDNKEKKATKEFKALKKIHDEMISTLKEAVEGFDKKLEDLGVEPVPSLEKPSL